MAFAKGQKIMSDIRWQMLSRVGWSWEALQEALGRVPPHRLEEAGVVEAWSVKDLIGHVTSWERQAMSMIGVFQESGDADALEWAAVDEFNAVTSEHNMSRSLGDLRSDMETAHDELLALLGWLSEELIGDDQVQRRVRVDGYEHYAEHTEHILDWLGKTSAS